jgi:hypothetical protein
MSPTALRSLVKFGSLRQIALDSPAESADVTDSCLQALATAAPNLTVLHIANAREVTNAGLAYLATLTQLQDLRLGNVNLAIFLQVGDAEPQFPRVRIVVLASTGIGTGIPHVKFTNQGVAMCGSKVMTPTALRSLAELRKRRNILDAPATDADSCMRALATTAPNLTVLRIGSTFDVTSAGLAYLAKLTKLQDLRLGGLHWRVFDPRLAEGLCSWLATLVDLQELALKDCRCLDGGYLRAILEVGALSSLRSLDLTDCRQVDDAYLEVVATIATLRELCLNKCDQVTDAGLRALAPLTALQDLTVSECGGDIPITDSGLLALAPLASLQVLRSNDLQRITDLGLSMLAAQLTKLRALEVHHCADTTHIGHDGLRARGLQIGCHCSSGIEDAAARRATLRRMVHCPVRWPLS